MKNWLLPFFRPYYGLLAIILVITILSVMLSLSYPFFAKVLIDDVFIYQRYQLWIVIAVGVAAGLVGAILQVGNGYFYLSVSLNILKALRLHLFTRVQHLRQDFFLRTKIGDITTRINGDLAELQGAITDSLLQLVSSVITLVFITGVLIWLDWKLFIFGLICLPVLIGSLFYFRPKVIELTRQLRMSHSDIQAHLVDTFTNIRLVKLSVAERERTEQLGVKLNKLNRQTLRFTIVQSLAEGIPRFAVTLSVALILLVGGYKVLTQELSLGSLIAFTAFLSRFFQPVQSLAGIYLRLQRAKVSLERISEYLVQPTEELWEQRRKISYTYSEQKALLAFKQVSSHYQERPILQDIDFTLQPREAMALLGPSGIGKSTLIDLIVKLTPLSTGQIYFQGASIQDWPARELRQRIAVISQDIALIHGTIRENLLLGLDAERKAELTTTNLIHVCQRAGLHQYISSLPDQYETELGQKGDRFSGGQKQRLAIARALLRDPVLLILDEATSGLDQESEVQIYRELHKWVKAADKERGLLLITHRQQSIDWVDQIFWFKRETMKRKGSHVG